MERISRFILLHWFNGIDTQSHGIARHPPFLTIHQNNAERMECLCVCVCMGGTVRDYNPQNYGVLS